VASNAIIAAHRGLTGWKLYWGSFSGVADAAFVTTALAPNAHPYKTPTRTTRHTTQIVTRLNESFRLTCCQKIINSKLHTFRFTMHGHGCGCCTCNLDVVVVAAGVGVVVQWLCSGYGGRKGGGGGGGGSGSCGVGSGSGRFSALLAL
jgi:hypothetical protein